MARTVLVVGTTVGLAVIGCASAAHAGVRVFTDEATFLVATGATNVSGPIPNLGQVPFASVGSVGFAVAPGGDNMAIGALGTVASTGSDAAASANRGIAGCAGASATTGDADANGRSTGSSPSSKWPSGGT